jgi:hypothetical protein
MPGLASSRASGATHDSSVRRRDRRGRAGSTVRHSGGSRAPPALSLTRPPQLDPPRGALLRSAASPCAPEASLVMRKSPPWRKRHSIFRVVRGGPVAVARSLPGGAGGRRPGVVQGRVLGPDGTLLAAVLVQPRNDISGFKPTSRRAATAASIFQRALQLYGCVEVRVRPVHKTWMSARRFPATSRSSSTCRPSPNP